MIPFSNAKLRGLAAFGAVAGFLFLAGCGDMLTYAQDAKHDGIRQYNDGRYPQASGDFRNSLRQDPTDPETAYYLGLSYEQTASYNEAIDAYKICLALMPSAGSVRFNPILHDSAFDRLARVVASTDGSGVQTDLILKNATEQNSSELFRLLGRICRYRGDADTALDYYRRCVTLMPGSFAGQRELGLYLLHMHQNQDASQTLRDAYRLNQSDKAVNSALRDLGMEPSDALLAQVPAKPLLPPTSPDNNMNMSSDPDSGALPAAISTDPQPNSTVAPRE